MPGKYTIGEGASAVVNRNHLSVRLVGDPTLLPTEELVSLLGVEPTRDWRREGPLLGKPIQGRKGPMSFKGAEIHQKVDVWTVELIDWWKGEVDPDTLIQAVATLERMASGLAALDRSHCRAQFLISTTCFSELGDVELPATLTVAAAAARLDLAVSIICAGDGDDD